MLLIGPLSLAASVESLLLSCSWFVLHNSSMGSFFNVSSLLFVRLMCVGEGEHGELSLSVLLMPLPSLSVLCVEFKREFVVMLAFKLSILFFIALGEKSAGWVCGGTGCDRFRSLLLLLLVPSISSERARFSSFSGSDEMRRSRRCCMAARRSSWLTVAPCGGDDGDVNSASSTNFSANDGWWFDVGVDCCCERTKLCTCANLNEKHFEYLVF